MFPQTICLGLKMKRARKNTDNKRIKQLLKVTVVLAVIFVILLLQLFFPIRTLLPKYKIPPRGEGELRLHFLSVGQGDCTVVEFADGALLVIDAGDGKRVHSDHIYRYLKGLKASAPLVLATHADSDHAGGLQDVIKRFGADTVYLPVIGSGESYENFLDRVKRAGCPQVTVKRYDTIARAGAEIVCLSPYAEGETNENDASAVLFLRYAGVNVFLSGDISAARERQLAADYAVGAFDGVGVRLEETDILKVAHHGSAGSSSDVFCDLLGAKTAIISCGRGNAYAHPAGETAKRLKAWGSEVYRTDELGDIMVTVLADGTYRTEYGYL